MTIKTRHISLIDFFNELQREYFCAELRSKIYTKQADKDYWRTIMKHKKNKIEDIALRNKLNSIFSDKSEYVKVFDKVLTFGIPNFSYRDSYHEKKLSSRDIYFYFQPGSDIKIIINNSIELGKLINYDIKSMMAIVSINKLIYKVKIENICRVV
jgi:hypothetical protein